MYGDCLRKIVAGRTGEIGTGTGDGGKSASNMMTVISTRQDLQVLWSFLWSKNFSRSACIIIH